MTAHYDRNQVLARVDLTTLADDLLGPRHPRLRTWPCPNRDHAQTGRTPPVSTFTDRQGGQRWHCHGCGDGGTAIDLVLRTGRAGDFPEALDWLARWARVSPTTEMPTRRPPVAARRAPTPPAPGRAARRVLDSYVQGCVQHLHSPEGREVLDWLTHTRRIPARVLEHVGVGADPGFWKLPRPDGVPQISPAAVFPVWEGDEVVYTLSRAIRPFRDRPRWVNTANSIARNPRLALLTPPGPTIGGPVVVTEGLLDALSVLAAGRTAAALLGTGIVDDSTADRLAQLRRPLLVATDNDAAGRRARDRLSELLADRATPTAQLAIPGTFNDLNDWHVATGDRWPGVLAAAVRLCATARGSQLAPPEVA
ncbi:MAG: toprim domain-containing protein [Acidimicrobiales bacterium]